MFVNTVNLLNTSSSVEAGSRRFNGIEIGMIDLLGGLCNSKVGLRSRTSPE